MSHYRMSAKRVVHESTGGTLASLPKPVDPVGNAPDRLTLQTVAPFSEESTSNQGSPPAGERWRPTKFNSFLSILTSTRIARIESLGIADHREDETRAMNQRNNDSSHVDTIVGRRTSPNNSAFLGNACRVHSWRC